MASPSPADRLRSWLSRLRRRVPAPAAQSTRSIPVVKADPSLIANRYRLEDIVGRGGTGTVYRARDVARDRVVAVKMVPAELLPDSPARQAFRLNAEKLSHLKHPAIVEIHDADTFEDGGGFLVMEFVQGEDLRKLLQREGPLDPAYAMRLLSAVCDAVEAAHHAGVLHRDLKPENVLLPTGSDEVKVLDFSVVPGAADDAGPPAMPRTDGPAPAGGAVILGTPAYMAPEQFQGAAYTARSDVFSLGVMAYEMLSGDLPFGRESIGHVVLAHARGATPMKTLSVPAAAERAIRAAIDPNPDRRPASPQAFAHLLTASLSLF